MGFWKRLFGGAESEKPTPGWVGPPTQIAPQPAAQVGVVSGGQGPHGFLAVVGESHCQPALKALRKQLLAEWREMGLERFDADSDVLEFTARLKPEPENAYDANAIRVLSSEDDAPLGYLARDVAKQFHRRLATIGQIDCPAELRGGDHGKAIGVVLDWTTVRDTLMDIEVPRRSSKPTTEPSKP